VRHGQHPSAVVATRVVEYGELGRLATVGHGTHGGALSVFPVWTDASSVSGLDTGRYAAS
jgi:hypothetical protein